MLFDDLSIIIIIPLSWGQGAEIQKLVNSLNDYTDFLDFVSTPEVSFINNMQIDLNYNLDEIITSEVLGRFGYIRSTLLLSSKLLNINQLSSVARRYYQWVKSTLTENGFDNFAEQIYPILIVKKSDTPNFAEYIRKNSSLAQRLLMSWVSASTSYRQAEIKKYLSQSFEFLSSRYMSFSPYGALIIDEDNRSLENDLLTTTTNTASTLWTMPIIFEKLDAVLDEKIRAFSFEFRDLPITTRIANQIKFRSNKHAENASRQWTNLAKLRVAVLIALAKTESRRAMIQSRKIASELHSIFEIDEQKSSVDYKIDALNSILEVMIQNNQNRISNRIANISVLLAAVGILVAILAIPQTYSFLVHIITGK